jgi:dTDP-4-amino-4,6-dideoxygalactose transaminase
VIRTGGDGVAAPVPLVDLAAQHAAVAQDVADGWAQVLARTAFIDGPQVAAFENEYAAFIGTGHCVGVANGTDAIEIALRGLGVGQGDEVILPANTFIATAEAVLAVGATPRFVDVESDTGLIDLRSAEARVTPHTKAVIPVHLYGRMVDMGPVAAFAGKYSLLVIEDAAQAHGASRDGRRAGTIGDVGCFSFYPGKNLGAIGDAGAAVTEDSATADRIRLYRDHGRRGRDNHEIAGCNSRMDPLQAAVLRVKLAHLERWTQARRKVAGSYRAGLAPLLDWEGGEPQAEVHHVFPILVEDRDELQRALREHGIPTGVHYRQTVPATPAFAPSLDECPVAEWRARRQLSLPIHPHLDDGDVRRIVDAVNRLASLAPAGV